MIKVNDAQIRNVEGFLLSSFGKRNDRTVYDLYRDYCKFNSIISVSEDVFFKCFEKIPHSKIAAGGTI